MSEQDNEGEKQFEASQKKLDDARKKGEVPRSNDLITTGSYLGLLLAGLTAGAASLSHLGEMLSGLLDRADRLEPLLANGSGTALFGPILVDLVWTLSPWLALPLGLALLSLVGQQAFTVTGTKLKPKLSRISLISNAKNKFGRNGLFEFAKSAVKLTIYCVVLFVFLWLQMPQIIAATALSAGQVTAEFLQMALVFLMLVVVISASLGAIDFLWQRAEHLRKNRMSHKEMTDEHKQSEGDPFMKQQRRQRGYDIAMNTMLADVPDANVVVVNPTHYAVALKWDRSSPGAPLCVAKGVDLVAKRIREAAIDSNVPIYSDPPTARALHAVVDIGQEVRPEHYAAVAVAIRFAEDISKKARAR